MIEHVYRITCDAADCVESIELERPDHMPPLWNMINNQFLCPAHPITIDGKKLEKEKGH